MLLLLSSCGASSVVSGGDEGERSASVAIEGENSQQPEESGERLRERFESNPWRIVDGTGFDSDVANGFVAFFGTSEGSFLTIRPACGGAGTAEVEWGSDGFTLDQSVEMEAFECGPPRDDLLDRFFGSTGPVIVAVTADQPRATLTTATGRVLSLREEGPEPVTSSPPITEAVATTVPQ